MTPSAPFRTATVLAAILSLTSCMHKKNLHPDVHGHRGCRGLLPENSIPAFLKAVDLGCDALELDVVITGDGHVLVSHEPWMNSTICLSAEGDEMTPEQGRALNIHAMTLAEVQAHDCGSLPHPDFPEQDDRHAHKPTLREVVETVEEHALLTGMPNPTYNVEIKSDPAWYGTYQPQPGPYVQAVIAELDALGIADRTILQSFDPAILEAAHAERSDLTLALLIEESRGLDADLARLSFTPAIYSPHFSLADEAMLDSLRQRGIELVVWTVNEPVDIRRMLDLGVDGIISDYPDRVIALLDGRE
mgnify:CR=1 FL=1|jgi:glycerophosphoryl diester phosphodiesterase